MKPSALIVSAVNWDTAFGLLSEFKRGLNDFLQILDTTYKGVPVIFRPGQYYCCRANMNKSGTGRRRLSRMRVFAFNKIMLDALQKYDKNVKNWDIYSLGEGQFLQDIEEIMKCDSNHMTRDGVDLENQILMNMLCPAK